MNILKTSRWVGRTAAKATYLTLAGGTFAYSYVAMVLVFYPLALIEGVCVAHREMCDAVDEGLSGMRDRTASRYRKLRDDVP